MKVYTDGACSGNPGPGGWGFAIIENDNILYSDASFFDHTTNNKMELTAAIKGIEYMKHHYPHLTSFPVHTDSTYTMNSMKDWVHNWKKKNWKKSNGKPIENPELIKQLYALCYESGITITWVKVKAHQKKTSADYDPFNDYVDQIATGKEQPKNNRR